ncbi:hypothetical protein ACLOJK_005411, partial [Asimina triloba]
EKFGIVSKNPPLGIPALILKWRLPDGTKLDVREKFGIVWKNATPVVGVVHGVQLEQVEAEFSR